MESIKKTETGIKQLEIIFKEQRKYINILEERIAALNEEIAIIKLIYITDILKLEDEAKKNLKPL